MFGPWKGLYPVPVVQCPMLPVSPVSLSNVLWAFCCDSVVMDWSGSYHCLRLHRLWSFLCCFIIDFVLTHNGLEWLVSLIFYNGSLLLTMARILSYKFTQVHLCVNGAMFSTDSSLRLAIARIHSHKLISVSMVQFSRLIILYCS